MPLCPTCGRESAFAPVCKCGTDLSLLQHIVPRADHLFNQALDAYPAGRTARALEYLWANTTLVPFDLEARVMPAKLLAQLERWTELEAIMQGMATSESSCSELAPLREMLAKAIRET